MGAFRISPTVLTASGNKLIENSNEFKTNSDNVFKTVEEMVHSDYISPDAIAIAREINSYKDELMRMVNTMNRYGEFCITSSNKIERTQDDIISGTRF